MSQITRRHFGATAVLGLLFAGLKAGNASATTTSAPPSNELPDNLGPVCVHEDVTDHQRVGFSVPYNLRQRREALQFTTVLGSVLDLDSSQKKKLARVMKMFMRELNRECSFGSWLWRHGSTLQQVGLLFYYPRFWIELKQPGRRKPLRIFWSGGNLMVANFSAKQAHLLIDALQQRPGFEARWISGQTVMLPPRKLRA